MSSLKILVKLLMLLALFFVQQVRATGAECDGVDRDDSHAECLLAALEKADAALNQAWKGRLAEAISVRKASLQKSQLAWLRTRNLNCVLPEGLDKNSDWLEKVAKSPRMAICVLRETRQRANELDRVSVPEGSVRYSALRDFIRLAPPVRTSGKWYFEITIDRAAVARDQRALDPSARILWPTDFWIGCAVPQSEDNFGVELSVPPDDRGARQTIGVAIDVDSGQIHYQRDGLWLRGGDSAREPRNIGAAKPFVCGLSATADVHGLIKAGHLEANFGEQPFKHAPLPGFLPLHQGFQWVMGGETGDRRVLFDLRQLQLDPASSTLFVREEFAVPRDSGENLAPNVARIGQIDVDCSTEQFIEQALTLFDKDGARVALSLSERTLDHRPGMDTVGGRFARTVCFLRKHRLSLPPLDVHDSWDTMESPISAIRIAEAPARRQFKNGFLLVKQLNETDASTNIFGKPSRAMVFISAYDCSDLSSTPLLRLRYDERGQPVGVDFFGERGGMKIEKNRQRIALGCGGK